jgi:RNA polymerase sigma factor for flagellar operon FliA
MSASSLLAIEPDEAARAHSGQLAERHMPLVRKIAWQVHARVSSAIDIEDLMQIGMVALVEAANGYEDRGHAFSTYASLRVRGAMIDHLRSRANLSRSAMAQRRALAEAATRFACEHGRAPGEHELALAMGLSPADYRAMVDSTIAVRQDSLDDLYSDHSAAFADHAEPIDVAIGREQLAATLAARIAALPEREAMVLQLYFVEELNLDEIGHVLGITAARVCQIKKAGLDRLRASLGEWAE